MKTVQRWAVVQPGPRIVWVAAEDDEWAKKAGRETLKAFRTIPLQPKPCRLIRVEIREVVHPAKAGEA